MKKTLLLIVAVLSCSLGFSQSQRMVFMEEFTQASCPPCETTTPALNAMIASNVDKIVQLRYQTSWPGVDPMNADNPTEVRSRVDYYGVDGVPAVFVDGVAQPGIGELSQSAIDASYASSAPLKVEVSHTLAENLSSATVSLVVTNEGTEAYAVASNRLRIAFIEEIISFDTPPGSTSLVDFEAVMKTFITGTDGMEIPSIAAGESWEMTWTDVVVDESIYDFNNFAVVAFIQNDATSAIINGAHSKPLELSGTYSDLSVLGSGESNDDLCDYAFVPSVQIVNSADNDATGYTAHVLINGEITQTLTSTDAIAAGATTEVVFDEVTLPAGATIVSYNAIPNNGDLYTANNSGRIPSIGKVSQSPVAMVESSFEEDVAGFQSASTVVLMPEGLSDTRFPFNVVSGLGAYGTSDQCIAIGVWFWDTSTIDPDGSFTLVDPITVESGTQLSFDYAYTSFGSSQDRLRVQLSSDCGVTWNTEFNMAGSDLATAPEVNMNTAFFVPTEDQWETVEIDMASYVGEEVLVRFAITSDYGDNMFIDNIGVRNSTDVTDLNVGESINVYPNPASQVVNVAFDIEPSNSNVNITVMDILGKTVQTEQLGNISSASHAMNVTKLQTGTYIMYIDLGERQIVKRFNVSK